MNEFTYQKFLEEKLKDQHTHGHLLQGDIVAFKEKNIKLLKDLAIVRRSENDLKLRMRQMQEKMTDQQMQIRKLKQVRAQRTKQMSEKRIKEELPNTMDNKQIFKMYLDNTFPKYKGLLKKILKILFILEDNESKEPLQKIKFYRFIFEQGVKRLLDWLLPKKEVVVNKQQLAENMVSKWKAKEKQQKSQLDKTNLILLKQASYLQQIQGLQAQILQLKASKSLMHGRMKTYERSLQMKGSQFVAHLRKTLKETPDLEPEAHERVQQILSLFNKVIHFAEAKKDEEQEEKTLNKQVPLILTDNTVQAEKKKKAAPIIKKNIFGYYNQPQFAKTYSLPSSSKHEDLNKTTQTLSQDLCILTLNPVIMVTLIEASINPQRTRHSTQHYVRIKVNEESTVDSHIKEGLQIIWNQPFLLKDYDFPFINVFLMHKSKGLRDYALGGGKFSASVEQEKVVNVRKDKQFIGRVRFSLTYPKGNIYQFKVTSVLLEIPSGKHVIKELVNIQFPYNALFSLQFSLPEKIIYTDKSMIILENSEEENMDVSLPKQGLKEKVSLKQFTAKQGHKQVVVVLENEWKVIIHGEIYLLICEESEPERIDEELLQGGKGKFFAVRAPPPIVTISYQKTTLHANIKFPLVFQLNQEYNSLSIIKELSNREVKQQKVQSITTNEGLLKLSDFIKAPKKIYKFFIETLEGEQVYFKHESHLFERLLKEVFLQISYKEDETQQISYARKGRPLRPQKLYKQFAIQTKLLMLNHYKVFTRHFKRIGFVKFKLGYTIYDNELTTESEHKQVQKEEVQKTEGLYFISLELTNAHLKSKSNSSSYTCRLNQIQTKKVSGNQPYWNEGFTFAFQVKQKFQIQINFEVIEHSTFASKPIYQKTALIDEKTVSLGVLMIILDDKGQDCLHFSQIRIPQIIFHFNISSIEAQIEQEADWIGKIDPYLSIHSRNRQLLKTKYLDNVGSHPVWQNIDQQLFISTNTENQELMTLKICDYDLIGRDDYIGEVIIGTKLNPELISSNEATVLYGNIVKDNQTCGSLKIRGRFKKIIQQKFVPHVVSLPKLNRKDLVYKLDIYSLDFPDLKEIEGEKGWIYLLRQDMRQRRATFTFEQHSLQSLQLTQWEIQPREFIFEIEREQKSFFKTTIKQVGRISIKVSEKQFIFESADIKNDKNEVIGQCKYFVEFQNRVKYAIVLNQTCCKKQIKLKSDLDHEVMLQSQDKASLSPSLVFYNKSFYVQAERQQELVRLDLSQQSKNLFRISSPHDFHKDAIGFLQIEKDLLYESKIQDKSERQKIEHDRQFKELKYIHWQPFRYNETHKYRLILKSKNNQTFQLSQELMNVYNGYLLLHTKQVPIVFDVRACPEMITIQNLSKNEEQTIKLEEGNISKVFVPNKGALYYHLEDYNQKSILQIHFSYIFLRIKVLSLLSEFKNISAHLSTSSSVKSFSCKQLHNKNCFIFENLSLLLAEMNSSGTFFFQGYLQGSKESTVLERQVLTRFKFGLRLQNNKQQYRFVETEEIVMHTLFKCCLVERSYQQMPLIDNTIYGMSFIQLKCLQFEINEDPTNNRVYVDCQLNNQHQRFFLQRKSESNIYKTDVNSTFFIESLSKIDFTLFEQRVISDSVLGSGTLSLLDLYVTKDSVDLHGEVKKGNTIIGRMTLTYANKRQLQFIDINMFTHISKSKSLSMTAQLQQFVPTKHKYQAIKLTSKGEVARLQSEDSFIVLQDPREYQINVSEQDSKKLLGEFKLCHELKEVGEKITVLQPLRTSSDSLNGVLIIEYHKKKASNVAFQKNKHVKIDMIEFSISSIALKDYDKYKDHFSLNMRSQARNITSKPCQLKKPILQRSLLFTLYSNENCELSLVSKFQTIGITGICGPFYHGEERVIVFRNESKAVGLGVLTVSYVTDKTRLSLSRQIVSVQASDLMDTEYFVKMTPYIVFNNLNQSQWPCYRSDLGLGKQNVYWKLNLITDSPLELVFKDKDMFFDDMIGTAILPQNEKIQKQNVIHNLTLTSSQGENQKGGNGKVKIITQPVHYSQEAQIVLLEEKKINKYLLRLGGINLQHTTLFDQADLLQVTIGMPLNRNLIFKAKYRRDATFYLSNKDIQIELDTFFVQGLPSLFIFVTLLLREQAISEQCIPIKSSEVIKSTDLFSIAQLVPLERKLISLTKISFWLFEKASTDIEVYCSSEDSIQRMHVLSSEKRLIVAQPTQLFDFNKKEILFVVVQNKITLFKLKLSLVGQKILVHGNIQNKNKQIGFYYAQLNRFFSQGTQDEKKLMIGKSKKRWLYLTVSEATLTKDLQMFSKMDPYCKFALQNKEELGLQWQETGVQDNVGLKPIWNESFFVEIEENLDVLMHFIVMDNQVTVDRKIGETKTSIAQLFKQQRAQLELFYKEGQQSGTLTVVSATTTKYLVIRKITHFQLGEDDKQILLYHENNKTARNGLKVEEGVIYPLVDSLPIIFNLGGTQKRYSFIKLKSKVSTQIVFEKEFVALTVQIYD